MFANGGYDISVRWLISMWVCCVLCLGSVHAGDNAQFDAFSAESAAEGITVSGHVSMTLPSRLAEAVDLGIPLYFIVEAEVVRPRWYWLDDNMGGVSRVWRLVFHPLTRKYRLSEGVLHLGFDRVEDALAVIGQFRNWLISEPSVRRDRRYVVAVRARVDLTKLPSPFQVVALTNRDWQLDSGWVRAVVNGVDR